MAETKAKLVVLGRDSILGAADLKEVDVDVPEWGGVVRVRGLRGVERDRFEAGIVKGEGKNAKADLSNLRAKLVVLCCVDEAGERIFSDGDAEALGAKNAAALDRVFDVARNLSGMSDGDLEKMQGNSNGDRSDASTSD